MTSVIVSFRLSREFGAACGHFMATYARAKSYQVRDSLTGAMESGRPVCVSKASPFCAARSSCARKLSASALVRKVSENGEASPTFHRTS